MRCRGRFRPAAATGEQVLYRLSCFLVLSMAVGYIYIWLNLPRSHTRMERQAVTHCQSFAR